MKKLKEILENNTSKAGRIVDLSIQILIILSLLSFSIETIPNLSSVFRKYLKLFELVSVIIFTIEYFLRIIVSDNKLKFIFSFYGLIDLLAILPFYLSTGIDLRSLRAFRLLRIVRAFKLLRYSKAINRFKHAITSIKEELILFLFMTLLMLFFSAVGIYYFENPAQPENFSSVFDSLWWALATLTTVGYGDIYPITAGGKIFTFFILMIGLGVVAVPSGLLASALTKNKD
ncbi:MAG: ion transporter [Salinivirgaceae bacterium]|nr:ion transporter [Salinivirgaceae bacterium]